ncbi:hypothetical protein [Pseudomonas khavaziana]|uniref:hypothetical protein n=1 Tax=Pseudomonas khavaziana TaxID=2842351 RepID=UPI001C3E1DC7|nr:hypothetical protein [Pseudomonas khavaziana]MBV4481520.1 hypothetical protein [Pseudomonas khavaziana]
MNYPSFELLSTSIGQNTESSQLKRLMEQLNISEKSLKKFPIDLPGQRLWADMDKGIQLELEDVSSLLHGDLHDDEGPWILTDVTLWSEEESKNTYKGPTPYDIQFSMTREHVRTIMNTRGFGSPKVGGFSENIDIWHSNEFNIFVDFSTRKQIIRCIVLSLPRPLQLE